MSNQPVLSVENLTIGFETDDGAVSITDRVSFDIYKGEIFGLVGESGCGKTITALSILRLLPKPSSKIISGKIVFKGEDILALPHERIKKIRGKEIGIIFQEPAAALNPLLSVRRQIMEIFDYHNFSGNKEKRVLELLSRVGLPDPHRILSSYPHELSGGMLQRIMIAMALLVKPSLVIADEPTTALDVTVQAQIMELLAEMQMEMGTSILFITHNLNLIAQYAGRLAIMYAGRIVEENMTNAFLKNPCHPYSLGLLEALPDLNSENRELTAIPGQVPQPKDYSSGCRFRDRCPRSFDRCKEMPDLVGIGEHHKIACFLYRNEK